jgi:periplasmic divalent cation tolerance protein
MSEGNEVLMVYMTAPDVAVAGTLADALVEGRFAACVNMLGAITSVYSWEGKIERGGEVAMMAKTTRAKFPALEALVKKHHPYACPCIVGWPLAEGHQPFLDWVRGCVS